MSVVVICCTTHTVHNGTVLRGTAQIVWYGVALCSTVRCGSVACDITVWYGTKKYDRVVHYIIWYSIVWLCMRWC